jgi:hypothetical protein
MLNDDDDTTGAGIKLSEVPLSFVPPSGPASTTSRQRKQEESEIILPLSGDGCRGKKLEVSR